MRQRSEPAQDVGAWIEDLTEIPIAVLSIAILVLVGVELAVPLTAGQRRGVVFGEWVIWAIFVIHFVVLFSLAPDKRRYLRRNWLVVISLFIPFLRFLTIFRAVRAARVLTSARLAALTNRALRRMGAVLQARRIVFAAFATFVVVMVSSVGVYFLERTAPSTEIPSWGIAVWWATRSVMNADVTVQPVTPEGRVVGVIVSLFGFGVFGVVTAALASWFVQADREERAKPAGRERRRLAAQIREEMDSRPVSGEELRRRLDRIIAMLEQEEGQP